MKSFSSNISSLFAAESSLQYPTIVLNFI